MLDSEEITTNLIRLMKSDNNDECVYGSGIILTSKYTFKKKLLEENKEYLLNILNCIGVRNYTFISMSNLCTLEDGTIWNNISSVDDFNALDLLVAASDACGFIINDENMKEINKTAIGNTGAIITSSFARAMISSDSKWLELIKLYIADNMKFFVNEEELSKYKDKSITLK